MGLFDYVHASGPEFVCDQGHPMGEMQTKDLGETMGTLVIEDGHATFHDGGCGDPPARPLTLTIDVYGHCESCPAFVQAGTMNLVPHGASFDVELRDDRVVSVTRTSETLAEFLMREPNERWMKGCFGPMPHAEAYRMHVDGIRRRRQPQTEADDAD